MPVRSRVPSAVVFPLLAILADGSCECGAKPGSKCVGKHPARHLGLRPGGYGVATGQTPAGSGVVVIDLDVKRDANGAIMVNGWQAFADLCSANGDTIARVLRSTYVVQTGSGGGHIYWLPPTYPVISKAATLGVGIDTRGEGGFVVGPGSPHANGQRYTVANDAPVAAMPEWLAADTRLMRREDPYPSEPVAIPCVDVATIEGQRRVTIFAAECRGETGDLPPSIEGQGGDPALYRVACRGVLYWQLPVNAAADIIREHYERRCTPPWSEYDIVRKCEEAVKRNREPSFGPVPEGWIDRLMRAATVGDMVVANASLRTHNAAHRYEIAVGDAIANGKLSDADISEIVFRLCKSPQWAGVLRYDEFFERCYAVNPPIALDAEKERGWSDRDASKVRIWLSTKAGIKCSTLQAEECAILAAETLRTNEVHNYLKALPPAPDDVLDNLASLWFGDDEPIAQVLMRRFMIASVARVMVPGTQVDTMLVLTGQTGFKKSRFVRALYGERYTLGKLPDITSKDASQAIAHCWVCSVEELDAILRARNSSSTKEFISRIVDEYRAPYGRGPTKRYRQCVMIGTTNEDYFLDDPTSARRYWPLHVLRCIDIKAIEAMRDVVWSAAYAAWIRGEQYWIDEDSIENTALLARHGMHEVRDEAWQALIETYLAGRRYVQTADVFRSAICRDDPKWALLWDRKTQWRVTDSLRRLGCKVSTERRDGLPPRRAWRVADVLTARPSVAGWTASLPPVTQALEGAPALPPQLSH